MAAWDPFLDPADDGGDILKVKEVDVSVLKEPLKDVPLDPWNDNTFVALAQEAAREAEERYEAAMKILEAQQEVDRKDREIKDARRLKLEQEAREIAKLSIQERREKLLERQAYADMAMEAIGQAPAIAAMHRKSKGRDLEPEEEEEDLALGRAAAQIAAADMGVKINFKSKDEASRPVALLFPDQNSKSLKMLKGLQELPEARRLRESARQILGYDPLEGPGVLGFYELLRGPEGWLEHTQFCQPVMYVTQLAAVEKLKDKRPGALARCKGVAGLSLGDYAALTYAGVWDFETGLRAVQLRGEVMEAAMAAVPQAALAVAGLSEEQLLGLCEKCREGSAVCDIAQRLFPQGFVCSGSLAAVEKLLDRSRRSQGCKQVHWLKLAGACHTGLMDSARAELRTLLASFRSSMQPPRIDVYLSGGTKVPAGSSPEALPEILAEELTSPANWMDTVTRMLQDGCGEFYECGPLNQLKGIMKRIDVKAHQATVSLDVYSEEAQMKPGGSMPPRWAENGAGCLS